MNNKLMTMNSRNPFIIHTDPLKGNTAYTTHTHGLTEVGMPELLIDPFNFCGDVNMISLAYLYFKNNKNDLQGVIKGETLKVPIKKFSPKWKNAPICTICFRIVPDTFEAVKLAYPAGVEPGMRFIQIWLDGDDSVLVDEYYRGGVRW